MVIVKDTVICYSIWKRNEPLIEVMQLMVVAKALELVVKGSTMTTLTIGTTIGYKAASLRMTVVVAVVVEVIEVDVVVQVTRKTGCGKENKRCTVGDSLKLSR